MSTKKLKPSGEGWVQLIAGIGFVILLIAIKRRVDLWMR